MADTSKNDEDNKNGPPAAPAPVMMTLTRPTVVGGKTAAADIKAQIKEKREQAKEKQRINKRTSERDLISELDDLWENVPSRKEKHKVRRRSSVSIKDQVILEERVQRISGGQSLAKYTDYVNDGKQVTDLPRLSSIDQRSVGWGSRTSLAVSRASTMASTALSRASEVPMESMIDMTKEEYEDDYKDEDDDMKGNVFVLHPYSPVSVIWDCFLLILIVINVCYVPYVVTYVEDHTVTWLGTLQFIVDNLFMVDILLSFRTGLIKEGTDDEIDFDPEHISEEYKRERFQVDVLSGVPFDALFVELVFLINYGAMKYGGEKDMVFVPDKDMWGYVKSIGFMRVLRITRFTRVFKKVQDVLGIGFNSMNMFIRIGTTIGNLIITIHIQACMLYLVSGTLEFFPPDSWTAIEADMDEGKFIKDMPAIVKYQRSIFKSICTCMTIGYGESSPKSFVDCKLVSQVMLNGATTFSMALGCVTSVINSKNISIRKFADKVTMVKDYMSFRKFPMDLRCRIDEYYTVRFKGKIFDEDKILNTLNPILREELINHTCNELIDNVPFFKTADVDFVSNIIGKLKFEVYLSGDCIIQQGTVGDRMYFIGTGSVLIRHRNMDVSRKSARNHKNRDNIRNQLGAVTEMEQLLSDGAYFGEMCLLTKGIRRVASVYADSLVNLYALEREDFDAVLEYYPWQKEKIKELALSRLVNNELLAQKFKEIENM